MPSLGASFTPWAEAEAAWTPRRAHRVEGPGRLRSRGRRRRASRFTLPLGRVHPRRVLQSVPTVASTRRMARSTIRAIMSRAALLVAAVPLAVLGSAACLADRNATDVDRESSRLRIGMPAPSAVPRAIDGGTVRDAEPSLAMPPIVLEEGCRLRERAMGSRRIGETRQSPGKRAGRCKGGRSDLYCDAAAMRSRSRARRRALRSTLRAGFAVAKHTPEARSERRDGLGDAPTKRARRGDPRLRSGRPVGWTETGRATVPTLTAGSKARGPRSLLEDLTRTLAC